MAKVLPILGTPSTEVLGYALGKALAMEKGIIPFEKKLQVEGATVEFRQGAKGVVTAFVQSGAPYAAAFSGIQVPETVDKKSTIRISEHPRLYTGVFPATKYFVDIAPYQQLLGRTRFGISPYSKKFIRYSQLSTGPTADGYGRAYDSSLTGNFRSVFDDTGKVAREVFLTTVMSSADQALDPYQTHAGLPLTVRNNDFVPCISAGNRALFATREYSTKTVYTPTEVVAKKALSTVNPDGVIDYQVNVISSEETTGFSWIRLRLVSTKNSVSKYRYVDVAKLPISQTVARRSFGIETDVYLNRRESITFTTNDLAPSTYNRVWQTMEFATTAPNGSTFVLRETNRTERREQYQQSVTQPLMRAPLPVYASQNLSTRGLTLSFVAPDDTVTDAIYTADIGEFGYLINVIPSADNKKVYVYYALHDDVVEPKLPDLPAAYGGTPEVFLVRYKEFLDVIDITVKKYGTSTAYTFKKSSTINLGSLTLGRLYYDLVSIPLVMYGTESFSSKLYGAALEVNGFIWAYKYCYDIKKKIFMPIPDVVDYFYQLGPTLERIRHPTPNSDRYGFSYLTVSPDGKKAGYYALKFGNSLFYKLKTDAQGVTTVKKTREIAVPGGFRWQPTVDVLTPVGLFSQREDLSGQTVLFSKPSH